MSLFFVKAWIGRRKANTKPLSLFANISNFQVPQKDELIKRLQRNLKLFSSNYLVLCLLLVLYVLITGILTQGLFIFIWVILTSLILITSHAVFYNSDAIDIAAEEDTEHIASSMAEEV